MNIRVIKTPIARKELEDIAEHQFGDWIKAVVDIEQGIMAVGGDLHADEEALLLEHESLSQNLWGVNLWLTKDADERIQFDSMINIRPAQGNRTRSVEDREIQHKIRKIINELVVW